MILVSDKWLAWKKGSDILVFSINYTCFASPKIRCKSTDPEQVLTNGLAHAERLSELVTPGKRDDCNFC